VGVVVLLVVGVNGLWASARDQGKAEAEKKAHPAPATAIPASTVAPPAATTVAPPTTVAPTPQPIQVSNIEASATAGPSRNNCGDVTSYEVAKAYDGDPSTTWRVRGDGSGQSITFTFAKPTRVTEVGVVAGYVKTDPCSGTDRFVQLRRLVNITWQFDGGINTPQTVDPTAKTMQTVNVNVVTAKVTLEIDKVTPSGGIDFTPVSEVTLIGVPSL
jgi:hypothetical protein